MRKIRVLPNFITAFGLLCGLYVIFKVTLMPDSTKPYPIIHFATILLLVAGLADLLDGMIARAVHGESDFGFTFDSLADAISFGVAPSVVMLASFTIDAESILSFILIASGMVFSLCAVLRLVRFNIKSQQAKGDVYTELLEKRFFTGLPVPAGAASAMTANLFLSDPQTLTLLPQITPHREWILIIVYVILGYLMVSRWKFPTLKTVHWHLPSFPLIFLSAIVAVFILWGLTHYFSLSLIIITYAYTLGGLLTPTPESTEK